MCFKSEDGMTELDFSPADLQVSGPSTKHTIRLCDLGDPFGAFVLDQFCSGSSVWVCWMLHFQH